MNKQFKALNPKQLAKLSTKERQDYLALLRKENLRTGKLVAHSLKQGLLDGVVTR